MTEPSEQATGPIEPPRRAPAAGVRSRQLVAISIATVALVASVGVYGYLLANPSQTTLLVYTYESLFGGDCGAGMQPYLAPFESAHHVQVEFQCPTGTLVQTLSAESGSPRADLVVGLDEITAPQADALGLLVPYDSPMLSGLPPDLIAELAPDHSAIPYEWGYLGIDYNTSFFTATHGAVATTAFPAFATNLSWARGLEVETPTTDITGEEFLLWEIEFSETVLHQSWQTWWQEVGPSLRFAPDWGTAFGDFTGGSPPPPMVVSYTTDPAYAAAYGGAGGYNSTVSVWNGTEYGWRTVYGAGIVRGSAHVGLDEQFLDFLLAPGIQDAVPTNEWEYPANATTPLPAEFSANPDPAHIVPLDDATTPAAIAQAIGGPNGYLAQWQTMANGWG